MALDLVFELLQWKFTARFGIRPIRLLVLSPTTGIGGALRIAYACRTFGRIKNFLFTCVGLTRPADDSVPDIVVTISDRIWAVLRCALDRNVRFQAKNMEALPYHYNLAVWSAAVQ